MRSGHRLAAIISGLVTLNLLLATAASAQVTPDEAFAGLDDGVYVQPGAEPVDLDRLATVRAAAAAEDIDLHVVVLADSIDAVSFAEAINDRVSGTVLVFTPDAYGASSRDLSQAQMNDALDDAADELAGDDIAAGTSAFVAAATPSDRSWGTIVAMGLLLLVVVAVAGRTIERRATAGRRRAALAQRWAELKQRADALSDPVLELSTRTEIDGRPEILDRYRAAATRYGDLADELARSPEAKRVEEVGQSLTDLERELAELQHDVTAQ